MNMRYPARLRSFRIRIALLSTLLSASVLLAFGLWAWTVAQRASLFRVDQSIRELGERHLTARLPPDYWDFARESLEFVLGDLRDNPFILLVRGRDGEELYRSDNWPPELAAQTFPTPVEAGFLENPDGWGPRVPGRERLRRPQAPGRPGPGGLPPPPEFQPNAPGRPPGPPPPPASPRPMPIQTRQFFTFRQGGHEWRVGVMSNPEVTLALGLNLAPQAAEMARLGRLFLLAAPAGLLLIALGGWWLAQRALRPVRALTGTAAAITAKGLDQRIPLTEEDAEFDRLIRVFNTMLDRLEKSFQQAVRFSADAAHELKTPLTILQGELAQAIQSAIPDSEQQQTLSRLLDEVQRLKAITRKLLLLSLADSGQLKPQMAPVDLSEMIEAACEDMRILAPGLEVDASIEPELCVNADRDLLQQVIHNLTGNAVKYNVPGGVVRMQLRRAGDTVSFTIANSGPGIPAGERERVFERFYRADRARNRSVDGLGLGLSLAREIVRAHHGELSLNKTREEWTAFAVQLPAFVSPSSLSGR